MWFPVINQDETDMNNLIKDMQKKMEKFKEENKNQVSKENADLIFKLINPSEYK